MITLDIHTRIANYNEIDYLKMFVTSFQEHHPENEGVIYCIVDEGLNIEHLPKLNGVVYLSTFPETFNFFIITTLFFNKIYTLIQSNKQTNWQGLRYNDDVIDLEVVNYPGQPFEVCTELNTNFFIDDYSDLYLYYEALKSLQTTSTINTVCFYPDEENKRNSIKTLIFPWEYYFHIMQSAEVTSSFKERVTRNCIKFASSVYYRHSGILDKKRLADDPLR